MRRTSVLLDPQLLAELERLARRSGRPTAHVIREAMKRYVAEETDQGARQLPSFVGMVSGPGGDTAMRAEEILRAELPWRTRGQEDRQ